MTEIWTNKISILKWMKEHLDFNDRDVIVFYYTLLYNDVNHDDVENCVMFYEPITALNNLVDKGYKRVDNDIQYSWLMYTDTGNFDFLKK